MVSRAEKNKMMKFMVHRLEESGLYVIMNQDHEHLVVREKPEEVETPKTIYVVGHNRRRTSDELATLQGTNRSQGVYTAHVFHKKTVHTDPKKDFFIRLMDVSAARYDKSLKNYTWDAIQAMLYLRGLEKDVGQAYLQMLNYYQPETARLDESVRVFKLDPVNLDYSHLDGKTRIDNLGREVPVFRPQDGPSIDYKLPNETIDHRVISTSPAKLVILKPEHQPDHRYRAWMVRVKN
ncbi:hypothetical protein HN587_03485 [Candidatus Woesearchaeota archaeon]|jgi:hypothetical protein|nr:hypothetical protein [Candidatus Woesearchaeota archaeon]